MMHWPEYLVVILHWRTVPFKQTHGEKYPLYPARAPQVVQKVRECCVALVLVTQSCLTLINPMNCSLPVSSVLAWNSPGKHTEVDSHSLLQGIFPTQGLNLYLLHCRWILNHLSHQGKLREWEGVKENRIKRTAVSLPIIKRHRGHTDFWNISLRNPRENQLLPRDKMKTKDVLTLSQKYPVIDTLLPGPSEGFYHLQCKTYLA